MLGIKAHEYYWAEKVLKILVMSYTNFFTVEGPQRTSPTPSTSDYVTKGCLLTISLSQ